MYLPRSQHQNNVSRDLSQWPEVECILAAIRKIFVTLPPRLRYVASAEAAKREEMLKGGVAFLSGGSMAMHDRGRGEEGGW